MRSSSIRRLAVALVLLVSGSGLVPSQAASVHAVRSLSITGPRRVLEGATPEYSGVLRLAGVGMPGTLNGSAADRGHTQITLMVDGVAVAEATPGITGKWAARAEFWGPHHEVWAVAGRWTAVPVKSERIAVDLTSGHLLAGGAAHSCRIGPGLSSSVTSCWGGNEKGQVGVGSNEPGPFAMSDVDVRPSISLASGLDHTCALDQTGDIRCWGANDWGQLGDGTNDSPRLTPVDVPEIGDAIAVGAGHRHTCAVRADGTVWCWGDASRGQLGPEWGGTTSSSPRDVPGVEGAIDVVAGDGHTCALLEDGTVDCWGWDRQAQLGQDLDEPRTASPVKIAGLSNVKALASGARHICALLDGGAITCWGANGRHEAGSDSGGEVVKPGVVVDIPPAVEIAAGEEHTCARTASGDVWCWGNNEDRRVNPHYSSWSSLPVKLSLNQSMYGSFVATSIGLGLRHSCATESVFGGTSCWGDGNGLERVQ